VTSNTTNDIGNSNSALIRNLSAYPFTGALSNAMSFQPTRAFIRLQRYIRLHKLDHNKLLTLTSIILVAIAMAVLVISPPQRLVSSVPTYVTSVSYVTSSVTSAFTQTQVITTTSTVYYSVTTIWNSATYAVLGPSITVKGYLPSLQVGGCVYLYGTDQSLYSLYNLPGSYPTGNVSVYGQYLTWEPSPPDSCSGIRVYVTGIAVT